MQSPISKSEFFSSVTHFIGGGLSIAALVVLVVAAARQASAWHVVSFAIFGASLILLYFTSSLYHAIPMLHRARKIFQRIDHAFIYVLIAGSYTPITLVAIRGGLGWSIFGIVWGIAIVGLILKLRGTVLKGKISATIYVLMGWLGVIAFVPLSRALSFEGFVWLIIGGAMYTVGAFCFAFDKIIPQGKWIDMHGVFHLFVMAGSFSHFWMMYQYVLYI